MPGSFLTGAPTSIRIGPGDGVFIAGKRGSGKSVIASAIGSRYSRVLVYDPQLDPEAIIPNAAVVYGLDAALRAMPGRVVYRPLPSEYRDLPRVFDALAQRLYVLGSHAWVIHELGDLGKTDRELPPRVSALARQARARRVPIVAVTQRPVNVPLLFLTQSSHLFAGYLERREDRELMAGYIGAAMLADPVPERSYQFWYKGPTEATPRRLPPFPHPRD